MCSCLVAHAGKHVCNTAVVMETLSVENGILFFQTFSKALDWKECCLVGRYNLERTVQKLSSIPQRSCRPKTHYRPKYHFVQFIPLNSSSTLSCLFVLMRTTHAHAHASKKSASGEIRRGCKSSRAEPVVLIGVQVKGDHWKSNNNAVLIQVVYHPAH